MSKIKKLIRYLFREELEIQYRVMNIILLAGIIALPVCILFDALIGTVGDSFLPLLLLFGLFVLAFYLSNVRSRSNLAGVILTATATDLLIPFLYFKDGGRYSSMPLWMALASIFVWFLIKGWPCYVIFVSNVIVYAGVFYYEYKHPEAVVRLADSQAEIMDTVAGIFLVVLVFGIIFKFQSAQYEKKKEQLEDNEHKLTRINDNLERANKQKSIFLASMSHEIRTPINAIVGMNEMILRESKEDGIHSYATDVESASGTLLTLVNDILDFSKIEAGLMEIIPDEYELFSVLNDCYTLLEMRAQDKDLSLKLENDPDIPSVLYGDEVRIRQILTNLMTNAVKYTDRGSITVTVRFEERGDAYEGKRRINLSISVRDTGRGISEDSIGSIFDSFTRVDEKKNKNIEGTGLGLSITKQLVDLMGGRIEVTSVYGAGSEFKVIIPQTVVSARPMGEFALRYEEKHKNTREYKESFRAPEARILVVDDVKINLQVINMLLKQTEMQIDTATSGAECLSKYEASHYDLILLDHMMPEMDGMETLKRIKETDRYMVEETPVVALTANATLGAEKIYLDTGFDGYLTKPVKGQDLEAAIIRYLPEELIIHQDEES